MNAEQGFREIDHTADWTLEVWAPSFESLCEEAVRGMATMSGVEIESEEQNRRVVIEADDREEALVGFLSEVLYLQQADRFGVERSAVELYDEFDLDAELSGGRVTNVDKEIKAVTWYDLDVVTSDDGCRARITFDV